MDLIWLRLSYIDIENSDSFAKHAHIDLVFLWACYRIRNNFSIYSLRMKHTSYATYCRGFPVSNIACLKFVFLSFDGDAIVRREQQESNNIMAK